MKGHFHMLRDTEAVEWLLAGVPLETVSVFNDWGTFSEAIENADAVQELCVAILKAGLTKDDVDEPDYDGLFFTEDPLGLSIDEEWDE